MILKWGTFAHDNNSVWFQLHRRRIMSPANRRFKVQETWHIRGTVTDATQGGLTTKIAAIEAAYNVDGNKDLIFYLDDGVTETAHKRTAASTLSGLRVIQPVSWHAGQPGIWGAGIEYSTIRSFSVVIQCEYLDSESNLIAYSESLRLQPAGIDFVAQEALTGIPALITTQQQVRVIGYQRGMAIGATSWPAAPASLFPGVTRPRLSWIEEELPAEFGINTSTLYRTRWHYHFESNVALNSHPQAPIF